MNAREISQAEAAKMLADAWYGDHGKHAGEPRKMSHFGEPAGSRWVIFDCPLDWIEPNQAGALYDGTVNPERAARYAEQPRIDTPVHLLFGQRMVARGGKFARINDGGHRISAARMRADTHIPALIEANAFRLLCDIRDRQHDHQQESTNMTTSPPSPTTQLIELLKAQDLAPAGVTDANLHAWLPVIATRVEGFKTRLSEMRNWDNEADQKMWQQEVVHESDGTHVILRDPDDESRGMSVGVEINAGVPCFHVHHRGQDELVASLFMGEDGVVHVRPGDAQDKLRLQEANWTLEAPEPAAQAQPHRP